MLPSGCGAGAAGDSRRQSRCLDHRPDRLQQCLGTGRQTNMSVHDFNPGSVAARVRRAGF
jgi:hypothetical protein